MDRRLMQDDNRGLFQGKLHPIQNECYSYTIINNGVRVTFVSDGSLIRIQQGQRVSSLHAPWFLMVCF